MKKAVVLLSGGMDSATVLYAAKKEGFEIYALSFEYGQKHAKELTYAKQIAKVCKVTEHKIASINLNAWGGSALTDSDIEVPEAKNGKQESNDIPITYVPARNMMFLSIAAGYAEVVGASCIYIGISEVDYSGYVDCRQPFLEAMQKAINLGTVCGAEQNRPIQIVAPLINMNKADEIKWGVSMGLDYALTWTCYLGEEKACGVCDSCRLRLNAFDKAGMKDPITYQQ